MKVFMFPGQGSQKVGMGKDLYDSQSIAKEVFDCVDDSLNFKLSDLMFNGDLQTLTLTQNVQPALMAHSVAMFKVLEERYGKDLCEYIVGHSLGEFSALCCADSISLQDTSKILQARGLYMSQSGKDGGVMAILGLNYDKVKELCVVATFDGGVCQIANDNSDGQVVISGNKLNLIKAEELAKQMGAKRAVMLPVSVAVHSELMIPAQAELTEFVKDIKIQTPRFKFLSNNTNETETDGKKIKELLMKQITSPVRFRENVISLEKLGATKAYEIGCGEILCGLVKRISPDIQCESIGRIEDLEKYKQCKCKCQSQHEEKEHKCCGGGGCCCKKG